MAASTVGMLVGPLAGGYLIDAAGWRAAYVVMAVFAVPCYVSSHIVLNESRIGLAQRPTRINFDWIGSLLAACGICLGIFALNEGSRVGWNSPAILGRAGLSIFSLAAFVWWELRCDDPLFDLGHFRSRVFSLAIVARGFGFVGASAMFFLVPFFVKDVQGRSSVEIGPGLLYRRRRGGARRDIAGWSVRPQSRPLCSSGSRTGSSFQRHVRVVLERYAVGSDRLGKRCGRAGNGDMGNSHIGYHVVSGGRRLLQFGCRISERDQKLDPGRGHRGDNGYHHGRDALSRCHWGPGRNL